MASISCLQTLSNFFGGLTHPCSVAFLYPDSEKVKKFPILGPSTLSCDLTPGPLPDTAHEFLGKMDSLHPGLPSLSHWTHRCVLNTLHPALAQHLARLAQQRERSIRHYWICSPVNKGVWWKIWKFCLYCSLRHLGHFLIAQWIRFAFYKWRVE